MIVLIVGPSGVGKTATYRAAESHFPNLIFRDLDRLSATWAVDNELVAEPRVTLLNQEIADAELFLDIGLVAIGKLAGEHPNRHLVVDFGAGFQVARTARQLHRVFQVIAITAKPEVAYQRIKAARNDERTFERYRQEEYAPNRVAVYNSAQHSIDSSTQTEDETCIAFVSLLGDLLPE